MIAEAGGIELIVRGLEQHRHECHVQYQGAAALRHLVDGAGRELLVVRAVAAGAIEALTMGMATWPEIAVVQGAVTWALFLLVQAGNDDASPDGDAGEDGEVSSSNYQPK